MTTRSRHLVFLAHVWACAPFLLAWTRDPHISAVVGDSAISALRPMVGVIVLYLVARTILAFQNPKWLPWDYVFPPIDIILITAILYISHRGPMSNITLLYFLPIIEAAGTLNVRWAALTGVLVVVGTGVSTLAGAEMPIPPTAQQSLKELLAEDPLNVFFRMYFLIVISSLMAFQARLAADLREQLGVARDRNRIALDMHDGVQGHLIGIASQMELLSQLAEANPTRAAELARESKELVRMSADEIRFLVQRLRSPSLEDGFLPALRQFAHNLCGRANLSLDFQILESAWNLDPDAETALFRVAQEAITNVVKHANASQVWITGLQKNRQYVLTISDDGVGIPADFDHEGAVGVAGMTERLAPFHGSVSLTPRSGGGTSVIVILPLSGPAPTG